MKKQEFVNKNCCDYAIKEIRNFEQKQEYRYGIMNGLCGIILIYSQLYLITNKKIWLKYIYKSIRKCINLIESQGIDYSFATGISGFLWLVKVMQECNILSEEIENLDVFENGLVRYYKSEYDRDNWDYLNGSLGVYFGISNKAEFLKYTVNYFQSKITRGKGPTNFLDSYFYPNKINLGLSHGLPSILYFLIKAAEINDIKKESISLIEILVNKILEHDKILFLKESHFESMVDDMVKSRLAWCYGDLSISYILYYAGRKLNDAHIMNKAIDIAKDSTTRTAFVDTLCYDACLCHGASGLYLLYEKFSKISDDECFKTSSAFWLNMTMTSLQNHNFNFFDRFTESYNKNPFLLEGLSGAYLSLLIAKYGIESKWLQFLLLDIEG